MTDMPTIDWSTIGSNSTLLGDDQILLSTVVSGQRVWARATVAQLRTQLFTAGDNIGINTGTGSVKATSGVWRVGSGNPSSGTGNYGDLYLDTTTGNFWQRMVSSWTGIGTLGLTGTPGSGLLPLSGGDLTGGLTGTTAVFSGALSALSVSGVHPSGNWISLQGGASGGGSVGLSADGVDANVNIIFSAKGIANYYFGAGDHWAMVLANPGVVTSAIEMNGGTSTLSPQLSAESDNILLGGTGFSGNGALATDASTGFPMIPIMAGAPSGTPVKSNNGASLVVNLTSKALNIGITGVGWYHVPLTAGPG